MQVLRNLLALIGLLALVAIGVAILLVEPYAKRIRSLDEGAVAVYLNIAKTVLTTGDPTDVMVHRRQVPQGHGIDEVERRLIRVAGDLGLPSLGTLDVHRQVRERFGRTFPYQKIHLFCDPELAADLLRYNPAMAAFLPCRVILYQDERGRLWLVTPNLEPVLYGGRPLPAHLKSRALGLQKTLQTIVDTAAGAAPAPAEAAAGLSLEPGLNR